MKSLQVVNCWRLLGCNSTGFHPGQWRSVSEYCRLAFRVTLTFRWDWHDISAGCCSIDEAKRLLSVAFFWLCFWLCFWLLPFFLVWAFNQGTMADSLCLIDRIIEPKTRLGADEWSAWHWHCFWSFIFPFGPSNKMELTGRNSSWVAADGHRMQLFNYTNGVVASGSTLILQSFKWITKFWRHWVDMFARDMQSWWIPFARLEDPRPSFVGNGGEVGAIALSPPISFRFQRHQQRQIA